MGRNQLFIAVTLALLGAAPGLQAETAPQPAATVAPAEPTAPATSAPPATTATAPAEPVATTAPATPGESPVAAPAQSGAETAAPSTVETKGDALAVPKTPAKPARKKAARAPAEVEVDGMPGRGATMAEVVKHFGKPKQKLAPVGKPPITRWVYDNYTVYFEHEYVIHAVKNEEAPAPAKAKPAAQPTEPAPAMPAAITESPAPAQEPASDTPAPLPEPAADAAAPATQGQPATDTPAPSVKE